MSVLEEKGALPYLKQLYTDALDFFFPPFCISCGERLLPGDEHFCSHCHGEFEWMPLRLCPLCGAPLGNKIVDGKRCPDCPQPPVYFDRARAVLFYKGAVVDGILALKFRRRLELADFFARILFYHLKMKMDKLRFDGIVPVPLHAFRFFQRGYNQAEEMGKTLSGFLKTSLWTDVLRRARHTRPQTRLSHSKRRKNVQKAFQAPFPDAVKGKHILLLDDVYTTGSTLNACAQSLKQAGAAEVTALAVCRAIQPDL